MGATCALKTFDLKDSKGIVHFQSSNLKTKQVSSHRAQRGFEKERTFLEWGAGP